MVYVPHHTQNNSETGNTVSVFAQTAVTIRALDAQRSALAQRYAAWRVDRTYVGVVARLREDPLLYTPAGDVITYEPDADDHEVELAALALQATRAADQTERLEAQDVLTGSVGADSMVDLMLDLDSDEGRELALGEPIGAFIRTAASYIGAVGTSLAAKLQ